MDIVVNHSSDDTSGLNNPEFLVIIPIGITIIGGRQKRNQSNYILFDVKGDAWKHDKQTNAYYLHYFHKKQPDLNWAIQSCDKRFTTSRKFGPKKV